ncbi:hypothetical protein D3C87_1806390 [compost metagenome]
MHEEMLPQVHPVIHVIQLMEHGFVGRETPFIPDEGAGIGLGLPARLKTKHIHRHVILPEGAGQPHYILLLGGAVSPVPHAQTPHRRKCAAA